jgi:hypothetical protein
LIEWIAARSQAVATEFKITITDKPLGPPTNGTTANTPTTAKPSGSNGVQAAGSSVSSSGNASSASTIVIPSALLLVSLASLLPSLM